MSRINKTQNNLDTVWNNLDLAYEYMERVIEDLSQMTGLSDELERMVEQYDLSEISIMKQEVEELMKCFVPSVTAICRIIQEREL